MKIEMTSKVETREYAVEKRIEIMGAQPVISSITEDVTVTIDHSNPLETIATVTISNIKKDGKRTPQNSVEQFFMKTGEILNNLVLRLSPEGRIEKVINYDDVQKNWEYIKIYLNNYFISDDENVMATIKGWIEQSEAIVKDEEKFTEFIKLDLFYNRYFIGSWKDYGSLNQVTENHNLPGLFGNASTVLTEVFSISEKDDKTQVASTGFLDTEESDLVGIAASLGIEETQIDELAVDLKSTYLFDNVGIINKIDLKADVKMANADFQKVHSLTVNRK